MGKGLFHLMKNIILSLFILFCCGFAHAQLPQTRAIQAGLELDALPYLTGGYFAAGWVGQGHWRARVLHAFVNKPDWTTTKGFTQHQISAYAALIDFFPKKGWRSWWIGAGPVVWKSNIQSDSKIQRIYFDNVLLNGSLGYNLDLGKKFYLSPWGGLSLRVAGDQEIPVDQVLYTLPLINPEVSLKLGFRF